MPGHRSTGIPAHSSKIFRQDIGAGAIYESARVLYQFYERLSTQQYLTANPGVALGGTSVLFDSTKTAGRASDKSTVVAEPPAGRPRRTEPRTDDDDAGYSLGISTVSMT